MPCARFSAYVVSTCARLGSMYLYAFGLHGPLAMVGAKAAMRLALEANLMNSRARSALGPPLRMHQPSMPQRFWSHEIFTGPPSSMTTCARAAHVGAMSISPVLSICEVCAPPVHHTA